MSIDATNSTCDLICRARADDGQSLGVLLDRYRNYLYLIARTQIDLHLAVRASPSDLVQETFLEATREFGRFEGADGRQLVAWLRRMLVNNIVSAYHRHVTTQKRDVRREQSLDAVTREIEESSLRVEQALARSSDSPETALMRQEQAAEVADMLAELPDHYREVIILRNLEGLPFETIAQRMGRTSAAVRKMWTRAIARLQIPSDGDDNDE